MSIQIIRWTKAQLEDTKELKTLLETGAVIRVPQYFSQKTMDFLSMKVEVLCDQKPTWKPLFDDCLDYHRICDEYPKAYVKSRTHTFLFHFFYNMNQELMKTTESLWRQKLFWQGITFQDDIDKVMARLPSDGYIPRVVAHLYPIGGGYLAPHTDPSSLHNPIQTLICGSTYGEDFCSGGLYIRDMQGNSHFIDEKCERGDLLMFDQSFTHEVKPIEPDKKLSWDSMRGRLQYVFLFARSDYLKGKVDDVKSG